MLAALTTEVWQICQTATLEEELVADINHAVGAAVRPAFKSLPLATKSPAPEFAGAAAEPGKPLTLPDGTVVTVTDLTPPSVTIHRPANTGTLLAKIGEEVRLISVDDLKNSPELMQQLTGAAQKSVQREFDNYLKSSGLSPDQRAQFQATMADRNSQIWLAAMQVATSGELTMEKLAALNQEVSGIEQAAQSNLRPLYANDEDFSAFQDYQTKDSVQSALSTLGQLVKDPLSPEQSAAAGRILAEEYAKAQMPEPMVASILWGSNSDLAPVNGSFQQLNANIQDRLAAVLTPAQVEALKTNPIGVSRLKNGLIRPAGNFDSSMAFSSGGSSGTGPVFKFLSGERSGMGSSDSFGDTQASSNGVTHNEGYMEVVVKTD